MRGRLPALGGMVVALAITDFAVPVDVHAPPADEIVDLFSLTGLEV